MSEASRPRKGSNQMKHDWECVREPYLDKVVDREVDMAFKDVNSDATKLFNRKGDSWHLKDAERLRMMPGWFVCQNCGAWHQGNYPPPEDWIEVNIIPDCATQIVKNVQET